MRNFGAKKTTIDRQLPSVYVQLSMAREHGAQKTFSDGGVD